jgi:hypothetical protein
MGYPSFPAPNFNWVKFSIPSVFAVSSEIFAPYFLAEDFKSISKKQDSNPSIKNHHQKKNPTIEVDASRTA